MQCGCSGHQAEEALHSLQMVVACEFLTGHYSKLLNWQPHYSKHVVTHGDLNHSILKTKYGDLNRKHLIHYLNKIKEIICKYQHKENMIKHREIG